MTMDEPKRWGPIREPVRWVVGIPGLASAVIALLIGFDIVSWTDQQMGLVMGVIAALIATVGKVARDKVTPTYLAQHPVSDKDVDPQ